MKILHISWEYPPIIYGGLGRHVAGLTHAQARAGHEVTVLTQNPQTTTLMDSDGVRILRTLKPTAPVAMKSTRELIEWTTQLDLDMAATLDGASIDVPDIVHAHDWVTTHAAEAARSRWDVPVVATFHATEAGRHFGWLNNAESQHIYNTELRLAKATSRIITCSHHMHDEVAALFGYPDDHIDVIPNGIDIAHADASRHSRDPLVVFVGRIEWEKGVDCLVEAAKQLRKHLPDVRVVIVGTGTRNKQLTELAGEVDNVSLVGRLDDHEISQLRSRASCGVVPSLYEPFGIVALEFAASGCPLVVTDVGGLPDIVTDNVSGRVVPPNDAVALADAIREVIEDREAATRRADALARTLPNYQWDVVATSTVDSYSRARVDSATLNRNTVGEVESKIARGDNVLTALTI